MKVGLVIYGPLDQRSGGYLYDAKVTEYLREYGDTVHVFSLPEVGYLHRLTHNLHARFWRRLSAADLDVLLQDELNHLSLVVGNRWLRPRIDFPIVSIVHHLYADEWGNGWCRNAIERLEAAYLSSVNATICNSRATLRRVRRLGVLHPSIVARPGGDRLGPPLSERVIRHRARTSGPLRLLFLGNVIPRKRLALVLHALAKLPMEWWQLDVVGSLAVAPDYARQMQQLSNRLGMRGQVVFHGRIGDAALRSALHRSHLLVGPSQHEGFGIVYLEAMAHGVAVIAHEKSAPEHLIHDGHNGFLVTDVPSDISAILRTLYKDRSRLECLGLNARSTFANHATWADTGAAVRTFLKQIV